MYDQKITINSLTIEITRRCNTVCKHCMRGFSQNIDIDEQSIDSILKQTEIINYLAFTGGEPTLCVDQMRFIFKKLIEYRIPVFNFQIVTNGYRFSDNIVNIIKDYSKLITMCRSIGCKYDTLPHYMNCLVLISTDNYHYKKELQLRNYRKYKQALDGHAQVKQYKSGNLCVEKGFAKGLPNASKVTFDKSTQMKKIEILDKHHKPICPLADSFKLINEEQIQIICSLYLTAYGNLIPSELADNEYDVIDSLDVICNVKESNIYKSILSYNAHRKRCHKMIKEEEKKEPKKMFNNLIDPLLKLQDKDNLNDFNNFIAAYPTRETEIVYINQSEGDVWSNVGGLLSESEGKEQNEQQLITTLNKINPLRNGK